jgi:hypothetical protein
MVGSTKGTTPVPLWSASKAAVQLGENSRTLLIQSPSA